MTKEQEMFESLKKMGDEHEKLKNATLKMLDELESVEDIFDKEKIHDAIISNVDDIELLEASIEDIKNKLKA